MARAQVLASQIVFAQPVQGSVVHDSALIVGAAKLAGFTAHVFIHNASITPVPFPLQTLAVLSPAAALDSVGGPLSVALCLFAGGAVVRAPRFGRGWSR